MPPEAVAEMIGSDLLALFATATPDAELAILQLLRGRIEERIHELRGDIVMSQALRVLTEVRP